MARPITWQEVVAPNNTAVLAAAAQAGQQITQSLAGLGDVATGIRDTIQEDATKKAVAGIMGSTDPLAAAAALPQGWAIDPLAVAQAAGAQDQRLRANKASDASLAATTTSTKLNQAQLDDRVAIREGDDLAAPYRGEILGGKKVDITELQKDPRFQTAAGKQAIDRIDGWQKEFNDQSIAQQRLAIEKARAAREKKAQANQDWMNFAVDKGATSGFQTGDAATNRDELFAKGRELGADLQLIDTVLASASSSAANTKPSGAQKQAEVPGLKAPVADDKGNVTEKAVKFGDVANQIEREKVETLREQSSAVAQFDAAIGGRDLLKNNAFAAVEPTLVPDALAKQIGMDRDEVVSRLNKVQAKYPGLDVAQAADIVLTTQDRWSWWLRNPASATEAVAMAGKYAAFNNIGRDGGLAREIGIVSAPHDAKLAKLDQSKVVLNGLARDGKPLTKDLTDMVMENFNADLVTQQTKAAAARAKEQQEADEVTKRLTGGFNPGLGQDGVTLR